MTGVGAVDAELRGRLAYSRAGRDRGRPFLIVDVVDDKLVMVADGDLRKVANPKLKSLKHLRLTRMTAEGLRQRLARGEPLRDEDIRREIAGLLEREERPGKEG